MQIGLLKLPNPCRVYFGNQRDILELSGYNVFLKNMQRGILKLPHLGIVNFGKHVVFQSKNYTIRL